jgi:flagellar assembly protein FliH
MEAHKYTFDQDFGSSDSRKRLTAEDMSAAQQEGYQRGFQAGQEAAQQHLIALINQLGLQAGELLTQMNIIHASCEKNVVDFALRFARKIGGAAIERAPIAPIAEAVEKCFEHVNHVPHLAVRIHESLIEETESVLKRLSAERGFEGRIIVLGDPDMTKGDVHLEWADGGVSRSYEQIDEALTAAVTTWLETPGTQR